MHQTKLVELLKVLKEEDKELQKLGKYLQSEYTHTNKEALELFLYIKRFAPAYTSTRLKKAKVSKHLFNTASGQEKRLNKVIYLLKEQVENFLIHYDLEQNVDLKKQLLIKALHQRNHPTFSEQSEKLIRSFTSKKINTANNYLSLHQLNYTLWSDINLGKIGSEVVPFQDANRYLDKFYFLQKLKIILEYKALQNIREINFELPACKEILLVINKHPQMQEEVTVKLLVYAIEMLDYSTKENYFKLKKAFFDTIDQITKKNARDILVVLNNANSDLLGKTPDFSTKESFELFQFADANDLLIENGRIRDVEYTNGLLLGLFNHDLHWTNTFVEKYKSFLAPEQRLPTYTYAKASCAFYKKEFDTVIELLKPLRIMKSLSHNINIQIQTLTIRAFFERWLQQQFSPTEEASLLLHLSHRFDRFIEGQKKLSKGKQKSYLEFTRILNQLIKFASTFQASPKKFLKIQQDFEECSSIGFRTWLMEKMNDMKANLPTAENG